MNPNNLLRGKNKIVLTNLEKFELNFSEMNEAGNTPFGSS